MTASSDDQAVTESAGALRDVRAAAAFYVADPGKIDGLQDTVRNFCVCARHEGLPVEQMLVHIKHALDGLPAERAAAGVEDGDGAKFTTRERIVALAIRTYYSI